MVYGNTKAQKAPLRLAINPYERIVLNDETANQILTGRMSSGDWRCPKCTIINSGSLTVCKSCGETLPPTPEVPIEDVSDFLPFYMDVAHARRPAKFRDKRVLFYRNRGIGDQLIASCLSRFFHVVLKARCYQLADQNHQLLWYNNPFIYGQPVRFPLSIDSLIRRDGRGYDWFMPIESVSEYDSDQEQGNVYDRIFALAGFDPSQIPEEYKRPYWAPMQRDLDETAQFYSVPYIAFQVRATNISRTLPPHVVDLVLSRLIGIGLPILCMDELPLEPTVKKIVESYKAARDISGQLKTSRQYGAVVSMAKLVVGPDSSAIHFAACIDVPCISLFGPFDPDSRVKYYKNHVAIWGGRDHCAAAPCYNFAEDLPRHKCPSPKQEFCEVFNGITGDKIDAAIYKLGITK